MLKRILLAALWLPLIAFAQSYPSPTFNNVTVQGTLTAATPAFTNPVPVASGGTNCLAASGTCLDNITGFASTGFLTRTGAGTYAFQSLTNGITYGNLAQAGANTLLGNATGSTANVSAITVTGCNGAAQALQWTSGSGFGCNSSLATSGANANITSLSGLTTPLSVAQGGTGGASLAQYQILAGSGTGAITTVGAGSSGQVLTSNGSSAYPTFQNVSTLSGRLIGVQVFTSSGTYTPTSGTNSAKIRMVGGGGGGGGCPVTSSTQVAPSGGGGAGAYLEHRWTSGITTETVTIGAGGAGGTGGSSGTAGGSTTFGSSFLTAPGGTGGNAATASTPPYAQQGGGMSSAATGGSIMNVAGGPGGNSVAMAVGDSISGAGGDSVFGGAGGSVVTNSAGVAASGYGSGGSGATCAGTGGPANGGAGKSGFVEVDEYN